jgi:Domain of unknown function (DUF4338)
VLGIAFREKRPVDTAETVFCARQFSADELQLICAVVNRYPKLSRMELSQTVCELLQWARPSGRLKALECCELLELLDARGVLQLPPKRATKPVGSHTRVPHSSLGEANTRLEGKVGDFEPIVIELVQTEAQRLLFRELVGRYHYLGHKVAFGAQLRYLFHSRDTVLGCLQFSSPAWRMAAREAWIGWDDEARRRNLQRVVNNSRFLLLPWVRIENLASVVLSRALRRLRTDWLARYAVEPILAETLVDRGRYSGHCYKAANWLLLGETRGRGRMDREHRREGLAPKSIWVYPLVSDAAQRLRS